MTRVLVISGIDPTGRAGLARDLEVLADERVDAASVPTALTVQTPDRVLRVRPVEDSLLREMLEASAEEGSVDAVKVGLLPGPEAVETVRRFVRGLGAPMILDPVLSSGTGGSLTPPGHAESLGGLVGEATLVSPNLPELEAFGGRRAQTERERAEAARRLVDERGVPFVLSTGGHAEPGVDLLVGERVQRFPFARISLNAPTIGRGKGCEVSTRIAALMAKGLAVEEAVPVALRRLRGRLDLESRLHEATTTSRDGLHAYEAPLERLLADLRPHCVPEVGMNLAYAPEDCHGPEAVLGLAGRITIAGDGVAVTGRPRPGGPHHTGRIAATAQRLTQGPVWVFNHRYDASLLPSEGGGHVAFRREEEPRATASSMEWMTQAAITRLRRLPSYISDSGMPGKEAMIRILGSTPDELLARHEELHGAPRERLDRPP